MWILDAILFGLETRQGTFPTLYGRFASSSGQERTIFLKLGLDLLAKCKNIKDINCFLKNYGFHSL